MKKFMVFLLILILLAGGAAAYWFFFHTDLTSQIAIPYVAHQRPRIDPHVPSSVPVADKLDEAIFDGLFNVSASASGLVYEDGLGELVDVSKKRIRGGEVYLVSVRLKPNRTWHNSYAVSLVEDKLSEMTITEQEAVEFIARDLQFTLKRIQKLGSLSPDNILVGQAVPTFDFEGPDDEGIITFTFAGSAREWVDADIKEVLSFKVLPYNSEMAASSYRTGTGPYMAIGEFEDKLFYHRSPDGSAQTPNLVLTPFIDNSTYGTELRNGAINTLLSTPFGAMSPILADSTDFFTKSSIATTFFALFYNTQRLDRDQRRALRSLVDPKVVMKRFFKAGTPQQRHIANYRGPGDNYKDYLNFSVFPATSYYVEEGIITPLGPDADADLSVLPDTVRVQTCLRYEFGQELAELVEILNDPTVTKGRMRVTAVDNDDIAQGTYDAVLVPISGYRSNFLFDLYNIFLREPDFGGYSINLKTSVNRKGEETADPDSWTASKNFFRIDMAGAGSDEPELAQLLEYIHGFMSSRHVGDKQAYSRMIDDLEQTLYLGGWLFSLPSLAYFSTQFDESTIDMYGMASQLSTIEDWKEDPNRSLLKKLGLGRFGPL